VAIHQHVLNLVQLCVDKGIRRAVISPGSRSAPITLALARHPRIQTYILADERSAGFVALGMAQQTEEPVIVVCTSGSAVYNLAPAVAEAYFSEIPLLLFTGDRPPEWIGQQDGQTIYQRGIFGPHVKQSLELPADLSHPDARWLAERAANEAVETCRAFPRGPVHLNIPLREPLYPTEGDTFRFESGRLIERLQSEPALPSAIWHRLQEEWESAPNRLIAIGQERFKPELISMLGTLVEEWRVPVLGDILANLPAQEGFIGAQDVFLGNAYEILKRRLQPDLLVTCGQSFLSKAFKQFLRAYPPRRHWHIQLTDRIADPFQSLTTLIPYEPTAFFTKLVGDLDFQRFREGDEDEVDARYLEQWTQAELRARRVVEDFLNDDTIFHEWRVVRQVLDALPSRSQLHLANSMPVRYANLCGRLAGRQVAVFANRGTSGIDGCISTAVGAALARPKELVTVLTGDVAFFYDRNALWHSQVPANLRIVLLNNHGGNIFRIIDGPSRQPELETYFETPQPLTAERTAQDAGIEYASVESYEALSRALATFFSDKSSAALLEITTDREINASVFQQYKLRASAAFRA